MTSSSTAIRPSLLLALLLGASALLSVSAEAVENESSPTRQLQAPDVEISLYSVQEEASTKSSISGGGRREDRGGKGKKGRGDDDDDDGGKKGGKKGRGGDDV
ncbi:MAG: hypothetical protein SGARI_005340, partial [Bacillariaceae sp.]